MKQKTFGRSRPGYAHELAVRRRLQELVGEMRQDSEAAVRDFLQGEIVTDAAGRGKFMAGLRKRWYDKFEKAGRAIAEWLADKADRRTREQIGRKLRQIGWKKEPHHTDSHKERIRELSEQSVSYIKSIPQKYLRRVQQHVAEAAERGGDRHYLAGELAKVYEELGRDAVSASDYAALVARDQSNKMIQGYALINAEAYGARKGRWIHVQGVKSSRRTHVAMDRKEFLLEEGLFDDDVGEYVKPGDLPYCQCQFEVLMPGFDD